MDLPRPSLEAVVAYDKLASDLSQWAPTVHRLVNDRIAALTAAMGRYNHPLETAEQFAARVHGGGLRPFPPGESLYDDLNCNTSYDHVSVGYELDEPGGLRIYWSGTYPVWEGDDYKLAVAQIHCPAWVVTDADGVDRYRAQTAERAATVATEVEADSRRLSELVDQLLEARNTDPA